MRELSLFTGAGGGLLGSHLCGWTPVCAVEIDPRCRAIIRARQDDGCLPDFPMHEDVRTFDGRRWRGHVDLITGGFPCPLWSTARRGRGDCPNLWPDMLRIIRGVEPTRVLAENVSRDPIEQAACDLLRFGYGCTILEASAASVAAPHVRPRWWLAADANRQGQHVVALDGEMARLRARPSPVWRYHPSLCPDVVDGMARGLDVYSRAVGNGQVPQVVLAIARVLGWVNEQ